MFLSVASHRIVAGKSGNFKRDVGLTPGRTEQQLSIKKIDGGHLLVSG
jgi:hypothetical protein